jgi:hypothetical protein
LIQRSFGMFDPMHNPSAGTLENAWRASANVFPTSSGEPVSCPTRKSGEMGSSSAGRSRGSSTDRGGLAVRLLIARRRCGLSRREVASRLSVTALPSCYLWILAGCFRICHFRNPRTARQQSSTVALAASFMDAKTHRPSSDAGHELQRPACGKNVSGSGAVWLMDDQQMAVDRAPLSGSPASDLGTDVAPARRG